MAETTFDWLNPFASIDLGIDLGGWHQAMGHFKP